MRRRHLRGATAATAIALCPLLAGCSGFLSDDMTQTVKDVASGTNAHTESMLVRNAFVLGPEPSGKIPAGGRAAVYLTLFDQGHEADRLVGVSAGKGARSARISGGSVKVPPQQLVNVTTGSERVVLHGLTRPLSGGESLKLTLRFQRAGTVSFSVPVLLHSGAYATLTPFPATPSPGSESATASNPGRSSSAAASPSHTPGQAGQETTSTPETESPTE